MLMEVEVEGGRLGRGRWVRRHVAGNGDIAVDRHTH